MVFILEKRKCGQPLGFQEQTLLKQNTLLYNRVRFDFSRSLLEIGKFAVLHKLNMKRP